MNHIRRYVLGFPKGFDSLASTAEEEENMSGPPDSGCRKPYTFSVL